MFLVDRSSPTLLRGKRGSPLQSRSQRRNVINASALLRTLSSTASESSALHLSPDVSFASPPQLTVNRRTSPSVLRPRVVRMPTIARNSTNKCVSGSPLLRRATLSELHTQLMQSKISTHVSDAALADREVDTIFSVKRDVR